MNFVKDQSVTGGIILKSIISLVKCQEFKFIPKKVMGKHEFKFSVILMIFAEFKKYKTLEA